MRAFFTLVVFMFGILSVSPSFAEDNFDEWIAKHPDWKKKIDAKQIPTNQQATIIGLFQTLALIPGVSRSGATIVGGVLSGLSRSSAVEFSFMLAIPLMLGATALDLVRTDAVIGPHELQLLAIGFVGSFLSALAVIKLFIAFVSRRTFLWFGIYRIAVASLVILF